MQAQLKYQPNSSPFTHKPLKIAQKYNIINKLQDVPLDESMDNNKLIQQHNALRGTIPDHLTLRLHRALSWLERAEQPNTDEDSQFMYYWIAFNAAYAQDFSIIKMKESKTFQLFMQKIVGLDKNNLLYDLLWNKYSTDIKSLLDNKYIFQPFWLYHNGSIEQQKWQELFREDKQQALQALATQDTPKLLTLVLLRLYTLRNQIMHGGATFNSNVNRKQLQLGLKVLSQFVPLIISTMLNNPNTIWGEANYPLIEE
ncbi:HEPN domain-containing protein [Paraferrimonas sp. SM1919]|uniref:HEPN domain-containing protein n=1 Tax=Paraferrimonas sp. SM1919 TaxID=2662263 RepID=UPI001F09A7F0|nr:HEPN domain-containing protein [Paraferrimonas sp. SM1919]